MEVQALERPSRSAERLRGNIGRVIDAVGTSGFEQALFDASLAATGCSHLTAFVSEPKTAPRALVAVNAGPRRLARSLAEQYLSRYWGLDPANRLVGAGGLPQGGASLRIRSEDIGSARYRRECYTDVDLGDRFSLIQRSGDRLYRLNFYARRRDGAFDADAVGNILESADLLLALLTRHDNASPSPALNQGDSFIERLRLLAPAMPMREAQVCAGIARGLTSEGIALENGIAVNTVLTYRKRAYARLGLSSQNELLRRLLAEPRP
ncbi:MAG TPA: helix-turn-helix transcriptional regulator [Caulobacteraceae bacterium]